MLNTPKVCLYNGFRISVRSLKSASVAKGAYLGKETPKQEIDVIRIRLKTAKEDAENDKKKR